MNILALLVFFCTLPLRGGDVTAPLFTSTAEQEWIDHGISFSRNDEITGIGVGLGGRIRQEGFMFERPITFRSDTNDAYSFFRSKYSLNIRAHDEYSIVKFFTRCTAFNFWDDFGIYTPKVEEKTFFLGENFLRKTEVDTHKHSSPVTLWYLEEAALSIALDKIFTIAFPVHITAGYFPYSLGRGIALGDYFDGAIAYLGFDTPGNPGNGTQQSPGILLRATLTPFASLDFYYSKWRKRSQGSLYTREEVRAKRIDTNPDEIARGSYNDRDIFAVKANIKARTNQGVMSIEPYLLYISAPELKIEYEADSSGRFITYGAMAQFQNKRLTVNAEVAGQWGVQRVHAIDRNHVVLGDSYYEEAQRDIHSSLQISARRLDLKGQKLQKFHSHILIGANKTLTGYSYLPYQAPAQSDAFRSDIDWDDDDGNRVTDSGGQQILIVDRSVNEHRTPDRNGTYIKAKTKTETPGVVSSGDAVMSTFDNETLMSDTYFQTREPEFDNAIQSVYSVGQTIPNGKMYNSDIPFGGGKRFRKGYSINYTGIMGLLDIQYRLSDGITGALCVGGISGDDYPFNTEEDKSYGGFVPFKDANYSGLFVKSYALFASRKLQRPTSFSETHLSAPNNYEDLGNLLFVGTGLRYAPFPQQEKCVVELNILSFWEHISPRVWDKNKTRTYENSLHTALYKKTQDTLHYTGDVGTERADSALGYEINASLFYYPLKNLELRLLGGLFIPGKLYKDLEGMPNRVTVRHDKDGEMHFESLGTQLAYGAMFRITYWF